MANVRFKRGTKADLPTSRNANTLYYATDTGEVFVGEQSFTKAIRTGFAARPTTFATGVLYVLNNGEGWAHNGDEWELILERFDAEEFKDDLLELIDDKLEETFDEKLDGVAHDITFNTTTHVLTIPMVGLPNLVIDIGALIVGGIEGGHYDPATQELVLVLADGTEIRIPAGDLIKVYTSGSTATDTIQVSIAYHAASGEYRVTSSLQLAASTLLTINASGQLMFNDTAITDIANDITTLENKVTLVENALTWGNFTDTD